MDDSQTIAIRSEVNTWKYFDTWLLGIAYGMTLQLVVIVDNYSAFVSKEASLGRED